MDASLNESCDAQADACTHALPVVNAEKSNVPDEGDCSVLRFDSGQSILDQLTPAE